MGRSTGLFTTFAGADAFLAGTRARTIPAIRSTLVRRYEDGSIGVEYHGTAVVTYLPNGAQILDSGGWRTATTKQRITAYSTVRVQSIKREWFVFARALTDDADAPWIAEPFRDGIMIGANGRPIGVGRRTRKIGGTK